MDFFKRCRRSDKMISFKRKLSKTIFVLILGLVLGIIAKWSDTITSDGTWFHDLVENIDVSGITTRIAFFAIIGVMIAIDANSPIRALLNVVIFYLFMLIGYYGYSYFILDYSVAFEFKKWLIFAGIYGVASLLIWYAKGEGWFSVFVSSLIIGFFFRESFSFGMWYFSIRYMPELIIWIISILVLHSNLPKTILVILYSLPVAIIYQVLLPYIGF